MILHVSQKWGENRNCIAVTALCFLLAGDSLQTCSPTCGAGETRKALRVESVAAVPAACYLRIFYASVAGYPAGHRVNRSFGPRYHAGAVDPTRTGELTDNFLTCKLSGVTPAVIGIFPARLPPP